MYLNCHTYYSLRYGTFSEVELLKLAAANHVKTVALTDINNTSACLNFIRSAEGFDIAPIVGIDFRNGVDQQFIGLAKNNEGYQELNEFLSDCLQQEKFLFNRAPEFKNAFVIYPFEKVLEWELTEFKPYEYIGISVKDLRKLPFSKYIKYRDRLVFQQTVTFRNKRDFNAHRLLRAIDNNILLSKLEVSEQGSLNHVMYPMDNIYALFKEYPFILENTAFLFNQCQIQFDFSKTKQSQNQSTYTGSQEKDQQLLVELCKERLSNRYPENSDAALKRMYKELALIQKMEFVSYFLINFDIISYAKSKGYFHVGRGSGANSIVAYILGITDVDPLELDLYFERFMNLFRSSPPDFDIDFSWRDRNDVTRYIFERFENVALMGTYVTFKYKGAVRELGKVFGLPKEEIDRLSAGNITTSALDECARLVLRYGSLIEGMPNYISVHSSGILISEKPLSYFSTTFLPPKGYPTVQFDMHIAEDVGLYKYDILGQRGLAKIKEAIAIIQHNKKGGVDFDIHNVHQFKKDDTINSMLSKGQCMGCFYVESPAMRMLISKLKVNTYLGLVAASSIIRPGVAQSGMMREYILRHHDPERIKQAHPVLLSIMPETYGVMVYQEDVIKVAHHFAGLSLGEADVLRRGMSGKYRSREEFKAVEQKFIDNCRLKGYQDDVIFEVWKQIESFAGYAFAKGHSASYAVESYQSLFLRAYFPLEYMVAVLNNGGGFYRPEIYLHEAKMLGATINLPCINKSNIETVIYGEDIYLGYLFLKDFEDRCSHRILKERSINGEYLSLEDFMDRVTISIEQLSVLIRIGAFRFTGIDKYELLWKAHFTLGHIKRFDTQYPLFKLQQSNHSIPVLHTTSLEKTYDQLELLGFTIASPFELLLEEPESNLGVKDMPLYLNGKIDIYGYLVTTKYARTSDKKEMYFATFLDVYGVVFDVVLFPQIAQKYKFRGKGIYRIYGNVVSEFGYLSIEVIKMRKEAFVQDPRFV
ncbi:DNA polymerase III subunit alpha [Joostella sp.]|uniref:DNA polymerase III subunit alpha n=1 Tax=Joostella sp. TaxID=2231138 RepID=UPI003A8D6D5B